MRILDLANLLYGMHDVERASHDWVNLGSQARLESMITNTFLTFVDVLGRGVLQGWIDERQ